MLLPSRGWHYFRRHFQKCLIFKRRGLQVLPYIHIHFSLYPTTVLTLWRKVPISFILVIFMVSNLKVSIQSTNVCWVVLGLLTGFSPGKSRAQVSNLPIIRSVETLQGHRPGHLGSCDFQGLILKGHCRSLLPESRRRHSIFSCLHHLMRNKLLSPSWLFPKLSCMKTQDNPFLLKG